MIGWRRVAVLFLASSLGGCGVRGNPRPPLPDTHPPPTAPAPAPDAGR